MTQPKHTPGPWSMSRCPCEHPVCKEWVVSVTSSDGRVSEADARLIVAAPDMYEALLAILTWPSHENMTPAYDKVRAAIAKAEGVS